MQFHHLKAVVHRAAHKFISKKELAKAATVWGFDDDDEGSGGEDEEDDGDDVDESVSIDTEDIHSMKSVERGVSLDELTPSLIGDDGPSKGYEVLGLSGVSLLQKSEKDFYRIFVDTQVRDSQPHIRAA